MRSQSHRAILAATSQIDSGREPPGSSRRSSHIGSKLCCSQDQLRLKQLTISMAGAWGNTPDISQLGRCPTYPFELVFFS
jgi:hypothetical protein